MKTNKEKIIYSIAVKDIYTVVEEVLNRKPTEPELKFVEDNIGERIAWFDVIENLLNEFKSKAKEPNKR